MNFRFSKRMQNPPSNAIRTIFKLLSQPGVISLAGGMPAREAFPGQELSAIAEDLLANSGPEMLQYGATEGYAPLMESACDWMKTKGIDATPGQIIILAGGQQGIDLAMKAMIDPGDVVLVESPTYLAALQIMKMYEADIRPVKTDDNGVLLEDLEAQIIKFHPKVLYLIPTFQNPSGVTLCEARREQVVRMAERYDVLLIEDDPYVQLRFEGHGLPALKSYDKNDVVLHLGSFSKIISPGLRVGVAYPPAELMSKLNTGKQTTDVHTPTLNQAMVDAFLRSGKLPSHIDFVRDMYRKRRDVMLAAMDALMPDSIRYTRPQGGMFLWAEMPETLDAQKLFERCFERKVAFIPGTSFFCDGRGRNTMRLNFSASSEANIEKAIDVIASTVKQIL